MGKNKPRKNILKPQNHFGGEGQCVNYDKKHDRCDDHYPYFMGGTNSGVYWKHERDEEGKLACKGNRHCCYKQKLRFFAGLTEKEKEKWK